jgi:hypothetical protein
LRSTITAPRSLASAMTSFAVFMWKLPFEFGEH